MTDLPTTRVIELDGPVPEVPKGVEVTLMKQLKETARRMCAPAIEEYGNCTRNRTFSIVWACRKQLNQMNDCMKQYTTDDELNKLKRDWMGANAEAYQQKMHEELMTKKMPLQRK